MKNRDNFTQNVKEILAKRAAQICSNPDCPILTSGPHSQSNKAINLGVAAHICAASPGGKRYNKEMTQEERAGIENAIWLCQQCAKLVDSDEQKYTVGILNRWKEKHERRLADGSKGSIKESEEILRIGQQNIMQQISEGIEKILQHMPGQSIKGQPVLESMRRIVPDNPPPVPAVFTPREALINSIDKELKGLVWLTLIASTGMGKTQIARIIFEQWPNTNKYWISLRGRKERLYYHIDEQLLCFYKSLTGDDALWEKYEAGKINAHQLDEIVAIAAGRNSLLVIDNLPDLTDAEILVERLAELGATFRNISSKVLTTSQRQLPQTIINTVGLSINTLQIPTMDRADIKLMLDSAGAHATLQRDSVCNFLMGITKGHPVLIAATVRWLVEHDWNIDELNFDALLAGEPMQEAKKEKSILTRRLISDSSTRDLLDRLSIVGIPFDSNMALVVSNTEPIITRPKEHFDELVGPWIQPLGETQFEISPILQDLWKSYLDLELQKRLHLTVAYEYLKVKTIKSNDVLQTCLHLYAAQDFKTLADFLINFMNQIKTTQQAKYFDWVRWFYIPGKEWPSIIPLGERILIRASQVRILIMGGQNTERYETDLEILISMVKGEGTKDEDAMAIAYARFHTGALLEQASPGLTAKRAMEAARAWHSIEEKISIKVPVPPESLFWGAITKLKDYEQIKPIIKVILGMSEEERIAVFSSDIGPDMSILFADTCYAIEAEKAKNQQDWGRILDTLEELQKIGELSGAESLYAASLRARAIVLADFLDKTEEALNILTEIHRELSKGSSFVINSIKASILLSKNRTKEAYEYSKKALSIQEGSTYKFLLSETLKRGMMAAGNTNHFENARAWCIDRIKILRDNEIDTLENKYEYLEMIGELAWIYWTSGYPKKSCAAMHMIVNSLLAIEHIESLRYKEIFIKTGHVLGWLASVAINGEPPAETVDGEPYLTPFTGIFCIRAPKIIEKPIKANGYLLFQLAMMASGVGSLQLARGAYFNASEDAKTQGLLVFASTTDLERASIESYLGNFEAAFAAVLSGIQGIPLTQKKGLETMDNPVEIWEQLPSEERAYIENINVFYFVMLPAFTRIIEHHSDKERGIRSLANMQSAIASIQETLLKYDRWNRLVDYMRLTFESDNQQKKIRSALRTLNSNDHYERLVLYMALASQPSAIPGEIANAQAIILSHVNDLRSFDNLARQNICHWIVKRWYEEIDSRSFRLNIPSLLRKEFVNIPRNSNLAPDAARLLLVAEQVADTTYDKSVREALTQMANPK